MRPLHLLFALPIICFTVKGNTHQWDIIHIKKPAPIRFNVSLQPNMGLALLSVQKSDHLLDPWFGTSQLFYSLFFCAALVNVSVNLFTLIFVCTNCSCNVSLYK